jgi:hypothetical protein
MSLLHYKNPRDRSSLRGCTRVLFLLSIMWPLWVAPSEFDSCNAYLEVKQKPIWTRSGFNYEASEHLQIKPNSCLLALVDYWGQLWCVVFQSSRLYSPHTTDVWVYFSFRDFISPGTSRLASKWSQNVKGKSRETHLERIPCATSLTSQLIGTRLYTFFWLRSHLNSLLSKSISNFGSHREIRRPRTLTWSQSYCHQKRKVLKRSPTTRRHSKSNKLQMPWETPQDAGNIYAGCWQKLTIPCQV